VIDKKWVISVVIDVRKLVIAAVLNVVVIMPLGVKAGDLPSSFEGVVTPITEPVRLVRRPFEKIKALKTETTTMIEGGAEANSFTKKSKLETWAEPFGDGIKLYVKALEMEVSADSKTTTFPSDMLMTFSIKSSGETHLLNVEGAVKGEPVSKNAKLVQFIKNIANGSRNFKSNQKYRTGDLLSEISLDLNEIGYSIKSKLLVKGTATYNKIPVLVAEGKGTLKGFPFGGEKLDGKSTSLSLIDLRNGITVFSISTMLLPVKTKGSEGILKVVEVLETLGIVNPVGAQTRTDAGDIKDRLRKLKEIHDEGLINDEEYKKKKDALLNQL